jgi:hypothetical protein
MCAVPRQAAESKGDIVIFVMAQIESWFAQTLT